MATKTMTKQNFQQIVSGNSIVLVDFWAPWCGPCRAFAPTFEASSNSNTDVVFGKVNTEDEPALAAAANIQSIPTVMAFRNGQLVHSQSGVLAADALEDLVHRIRWLDTDDFGADDDAPDEAPVPVPVPASNGPVEHRAGPARGPQQWPTR